MPKAETNASGVRSWIEGTGANTIYHVGSLKYTRAALAMLFFWLLWGDFCYTVMEAVTGPIMQLKFKALDASNKEIALILVALPSLLYSFLNPVISFRSDRYRSRWGRRIPFILGSLPFLVMFLVALGFGDRIAFWLHANVGYLAANYSANQVAIVTLGGLLILFTFFNTFVTSTFWYLFNDVVPEHLLARFMAVFRTIGTLSGAMYNFYIFPYSGSHSTEIFICAALLYLTGFGLMCYNVREPEYPPAPPYVGGKSGTLPAIMTYAKETHAYPHYWYLWLCTFIGGIGGGAGVIGGGAFGLYFFQALGLSLQQIGNMNGYLGLTVSVLTLGAGWLADRYHPIRVVVLGTFLGMVVVTPANLIWLFWTPSPQMAYWVALFIVIGLHAPATSLGGMWDPPMIMRLFPRSHYGQFCSINAVWRTMGGVVGGLLVGAYLDYLTPIVGKDRAYFYLPLWSMAFSIPSFILLYGLYRSWKKHGGDEAYIAPVLQSTVNPAQSAVQPIVP